MRRHRFLAAAAASALIVGVTAPAALAYDSEAYEYAAGHMITRDDIPRSLGDFDSVLRFSAGPSFKSSLCYLPSATEGDPGTDIYMRKGTLQYTASYDRNTDGGPSINVQITQYASSTAAISAFEALKKQARQCSGTGSSSFSDEDGMTYTNAWSVSNAVVPMDSVAGVESISITQNNASTNSGSDKRYLNDDYSVFSLVDSVIIETTFLTNSGKDMTKAQRKAVNEVAFRAIGRWVGQ
jgi:hypothetical protein